MLWITGLLPVAMAAFGWFPTEMPGWLPFLSFLDPLMPQIPDDPVLVERGGGDYRLYREVLRDDGLPLKSK